MARTRTLTDLIADVRDRADVENSTHVTDAQITRYINQSGAALHAMMVEHDEDEFTEELTLTAAAGVEYSTIGTGAGGEFLEVKPYKIVGVDVVDSNGISYPVPRYMHGERANLESAGITSVFQLTRYRWRAGVTQQARTVAGGALAGQVLGGVLKRSHLRCNAFVAVGIAEVGDEGNFVHLGQLVQARPGGSQAHWGKSQTIHSAVHFDEYPMRDLCFVTAQHVDLLVAMHGVPEVQTRTNFQIAGLEHAF